MLQLLKCLMSKTGTIYRLFHAEWFKEIRHGNSAIGYQCKHAFYLSILSTDYWKFFCVKWLISRLAEANLTDFLGVWLSSKNISKLVNVTVKSTCYAPNYLHSRSWKVRFLDCKFRKCRNELIRITLIFINRPSSTIFLVITLFKDPKSDILL